MIKSIDRKIVCHFILLMALSVICACILWKADWIFDYYHGDDWQLVSRTAIGKPSRSFSVNCRFWPLGLCDYTILLFVPYGKTAMAHYIYNCVMMTLSVLMMFSLLNKITRNNYAISLFSLLILFLISSFVYVHISCIFSERMIFFMFSAFMLCSFTGYKKQSSQHYFLAFLAATYAIFLKEPVFGTIAIIALTNLIFSKTSTKDRIFNYALLTSSISFIVIYVYRLFCKNNRGAPYAKIASSFSELQLFSPFQSEPILCLMAIIVCVRAYSLLIKKDRSQVFTDSLLFGGFGYVIAYSILWFGLHACRDYYVFPAVVLFLPSFAASLLENKSYRFAIMGISILCSASTIKTSMKYVSDIWKHREEDSLIFRRIVNEWQSGKNIYWITLENCPLYYYSNFFFPIVEHFLHCYGGGKCRLKKVSDPDEINANSIVLCHEEMEQSHSFPSISEKINECGLGLVVRRGI